MPRQSVYVAASNQHVGKTTMTLGLVAALKDKGIDVGYCKPVGQQYLNVDGKRVDKDAVLFASTMQFELQADLHSPVILGPGDTAAFLDDEVQEDLQAKIVDAADTLTSRHQIVVHEGTGHPGVGSVVDLSNAVVAKAISAKVILLLEGGIGSTIDRLTLCESMFRNKGVKVSGVIVNKVLPAKMDKVERYVTKALKRRGIELLGLVPYDEILVYPTMRHVMKAVKGKLIYGPEHLSNVVHDTIAGASLTVEEDPSNLLLVVSRERFHDVIDRLERVFTERNMPPDLAGLIITGQGDVEDDELERVSHMSIPVVTTQYDTYDAVVHLGHLVAKIDKSTPAKIRRAVELFKEHVDVDRILEIISGKESGN